MKALSTYAIVAFLLLVSSAMLTSGRPRFERKELREKRRILKEALMARASNKNGNKEIQREEYQSDFFEKLFKLKDFEPGLSVITTNTPTLSVSAHAPSETTTDSSRQAKIRVRRRCLAGQWPGCRKPTKKTMPRNRQHQRKHANHT